MTAGERYRQGSILYADELVGKEDPCSALQHYQNALAIATDEITQSKLTKATNSCNELNAPAEEEEVPTDEVLNQHVEVRPTVTEDTT